MKYKSDLSLFCCHLFDPVCSPESPCVGCPYPRLRDAVWNINVDKDKEVTYEDKATWKWLLREEGMDLDTAIAKQNGSGIFKWLNYADGLFARKEALYNWVLLLVNRMG